ncbi:MAG TPA: VanW family protein [Gaiellaceae bacterium]|nr:VanW family protein [Gaiellaceae bacterium]
MRAEATTPSLRVRRRRSRIGALGAARRGLLALAGALGIALVVVWLLFAGSSGRLAEGVTIAGIDVGGMTAAAARAELRQRAASVEAVPVAFSAGNESWELTPRQLGVKVDWAAAVDAARREGDGFGPIRGIRRLQTRFFGEDIAPPVRVYDAALRHHVQRIATAVAQAPREAAVVLRGLRPEVVPAQVGRSLDVRAAEATVVRSLAAFARGPVGLPVRIERPKATAAELRPVAAQVRVALSAPVRLALGETRWRLPRWRIAQLLLLPSGGAAELAVGGPAAEAWLERLATRVDRPARDATFVGNDDGAVSVVPARPGVELDAAATAERLLEAALSPTRRLARVAVATAAPTFSTAEAEALGITTVLTSFSTPYSGTADRIQNLRLAVSLLDGARIAPGATFSFNERVGERTLERGFRPAPVIIGNKYEEGVGGGVSQVATTVFNAAWEAGLPIAERAPHALYISRYPLGRDATVNYPNLDLKFSNDTGRWIVLRAGAGGSGIWVSLYGADTGRRVASAAGALKETGAPKTEFEKDATMLEGQTVVEFAGEPSRSVSVERVVYDRDGDVLRRETWTTNYRSEPKLVRVGTRPRPRPAPVAKPEEETPPTTTTGPAATDPTPTTPATTPTAPTTTQPAPDRAPPPPQPQ